MDELLAAAAAAMNAPEDMVHRSASARAKAQGVAVEDVLRAWSGGGDIESSGAAPAATAAPAETGGAVPAPTEPEGPAVEVIEADTVPVREESTTDDEPEPEFESEEEAAAAGALPRWLVSLFVVIPAFAVAYALFLPNGPNCGDSGSLAIDPATGEAVNCDGSPYGEDVVDYFAIGQEAYATCAACHGAGGGGVASFPGFTEGALLATFPEGSCSDHVEWIRVGSDGWPDPTYGANATPVGASGAAMPGFGASLTELELQAVSVYERVAFAGTDLEATIADCVPDAGGEEEAAALGE